MLPLFIINDHWLNIKLSNKIDLHLIDFLWFGHTEFGNKAKICGLNWERIGKYIHTHRLTVLGRLSLKKLFISPPVMSSRRMKRGRICRLTPMQRTMFWWLNLLRIQNSGKTDPNDSCTCSKVDFLWNMILTRLSYFYYYVKQSEMFGRMFMW